jgi:phosphomannomutase
VVDPDTIAWLFICEDGEMFGKYTLVVCADYVLSKTQEYMVSNMSSSCKLLV